MPEPHQPDAYLGVVASPETGLYHGAMWANRPTPSGCDRYMLAASLGDGHGTAREAAAAANAAFPALSPLDVEAYASNDVSLDGIRIPAAATVTRITTQRPGADMDGCPDVEVRLDGRTLHVPVSREQFDRMRLLGMLERHSGSGSNPNLYYKYDHFGLTKLGVSRFS